MTKMVQSATADNTGNNEGILQHSDSDTPQWQSMQCISSAQHLSTASLHGTVKSKQACRIWENLNLASKASWRFQIISNEQRACHITALLDGTIVNSLLQTSLCAPIHKLLLSKLVNLCKHVTLCPTVKKPNAKPASKPTNTRYDAQCNVCQHN